METYPTDLLDQRQLDLLVQLERETRDDLAALIRHRKETAARVHGGEELAVPERTAAVRDDDSWTVTPHPADLTYRLVELATPATADNAKAALASGADVWVADLEDQLAPTPARLLEAQRVIEQVAATRNGDAAPGVPTLMVRPRGLHLFEAHLEVDGRPASASLVDVFVFLARCGRTLVDNGTGPYLYLPKVEVAEDARWWNRLLSRAEELLDLPHGCTRVSVLVETVPCIYELEEIVHELRERVTGLAAGRWDYIFSHLRTYGHRADHVLPDRDAFTMNTRFLRTYTDAIVRVCRRHGVQAIGGPIALAAGGPFDQHTTMTHARVHRDKDREASEGFDGAWVLHPALVPVARAPFEERNKRQGGAPRFPKAPENPRPSGEIDAEALRDVSSVGGTATLTGVRTALRSSLTYLTAWLAGEGTVTIAGHVEDFGTVELARTQLWQWLAHGTRFAEGPTMNEILLDRMMETEVALLRRRGAREDLLDRAAQLLRDAIVTDTPPAFLSRPAYLALLEVDAQRAAEPAEVEPVESLADTQEPVATATP